MMTYRSAHVALLMVMVVGCASTRAAEPSKGLSVDQAKAKAEALTRTVYQGAHLYPELEEQMSPGFYGLELHWDQAVEGSQVAAFLQVDRLNGNVFEVSGVTCYQYGQDKKMHEVHPHGALRLPDVCM
ncbi:hypothetical protein [Luteibacter aegosomatissinici]|uniref:hypothetical protein n=1 Tax=Luteibacter aegosomatissinici TaxID=2911539 RepID=UPI001FFB2C56|nr:hypothetical protein [Luteibacter aegosomatissinici]UPG96596.1 hypothetical protein L2Y97_10900 [Luteibacter aegosomatissinici]